MVLSTWTLMILLGISSNNNTSHSSSLLLLSTNMHLSDPSLFWLLWLRPRLSKVERKTDIPEYQSMSTEFTPEPLTPTTKVGQLHHLASPARRFQARERVIRRLPNVRQVLATRALSPALFKKALSRLHRSNHLFYLNKICLFAQKNCVCTHAQLGLSIGPVDSVLPQPVCHKALTLSLSHAA